VSNEVVGRNGIQYLRISLASAAENWLNNDIRVHIGLRTKSWWAKGQKERPVGENAATDIFELLEDGFIYLAPTLLYGLWWFIWHLKAKKSYSITQGTDGETELAWVSANIMDAGP
jgi:hypothetical protein